MCSESVAEQIIRESPPQFETWPMCVQIAQQKRIYGSHMGQPYVTHKECHRAPHGSHMGYIRCGLPRWVP